MNKKAESKCYMTQKTRDRIIWDFLLKKIGNRYGAAALMGNLYAESELRPDVLEYEYHKKLGFSSKEYTEAVDSGSYENFIKDKAGYGLAQWTFWKRKEKLYCYAKATDVSINNLDMQLEFLLMELNEDYPSVMYALKNAEDIKKASDVVISDFENPADQSREVKLSRASYGKRFFYRYINLEELDEELQIFSKWRDDISFFLMDYPSGQIIHQRNADSLRPVGSIAKLMSAYALMNQVFQDKDKLREIVTIDKETAEMSCNRHLSGGEHFREGEELRAEKLLALMLVNSSCPGTLALVKHYFDSKENFLEIMNELAQKIGMDAHFEDFIGLSPYNSCNAISAAKLGEAILRDYPEILTYTSMKGIMLKGIHYPNSSLFVSRDYYVQGVDGLKTGTTLCAGYCYLATAKRNDRRVISVVLGALEKEELYEETAGLLEFGLEQDK